MGMLTWWGITYRRVVCGYGEATLEQSYFAPLPAGGNNIDFAGFHIDNIALQIDSLTFKPGDLWTELSWSFLLYGKLRAVVFSQP